MVDIKEPRLLARVDYGARRLRTPRSGGAAPSGAAPSRLLPRTARQGTPRDPNPTSTCCPHLPPGQGAGDFPGTPRRKTPRLPP